MAVYLEGVKAMMAGSGKAPAILTYHTNDTIGNITTLGYFDALQVEVNDIIYTTPNDATNFTPIICVMVDRSAPVGSQTNFSTMATFVGDVRATDVAGYQSDNLGVGVGAATGVFTQYTYRNNTDTLATISADGYFEDCEMFFEIGDIVEVVGNDGHALLEITAVSGSSVTTRTITFI